MSRDGPQSGPYQHEPDEPYHPPSDPWDGQDPWGGPTMPNAPYSGAAQPGGGWSGGGGAGGQETGHVPGGGYGPPAPPAMSTGYGYSQPGWSAPAPPPSRRTGWLVALVIVLVLVVAGGVAAALLVLRDRSPGGTAGPTAAPTADPTPTPTATATAEPDPSALPNVGLDASFARPDDCVVNVGTEDAVALQVVDCDEPDVEDDATVYLVITRYEGGPAGQEVAEEKCGEDPGDGEYTNWYYFDSPTPALSFVLCLNKIDR